MTPEWRGAMEEEIKRIVDSEPPEIAADKLRGIALALTADLTAHLMQAEAHYERMRRLQMWTNVLIAGLLIAIALRLAL